MKIFGYLPIGYFNRWLAEPIHAAAGEAWTQRARESRDHIASLPTKFKIDGPC
jgi:hypothetical protein